MSKEIKQKADELVESFADYVCIDYQGNEDPIEGCKVQCAILSVKNTIDVLEKAKLKIDLDYKYDIANIIDEQNAILNELKSRI